MTGAYFTLLQVCAALSCSVIYCKFCFRSSTAQAAHLQYNSPLNLYSAKNAQNALSVSVPGDSAAGQTIK